MNSPLLQLPGAVPAPPASIDAGVAWHHGDPLAEQRLAASGAVVVDRSHREVLTVTGEDRLSWLHSLTTQQLTDLPDRTVTEALVLDVNGRLEHHVELVDVDGTTWLDTERGYGAGLLAYLDRMVFWSKVEPADGTSEHAVLSLRGPSTAGVLTAAGLPAPEAGHTAVAGGVLVRRQPWPDLDAADLIVPRSLLGEHWTRLTVAGAAPAGTLAFEALRAQAVRPRLGVDTDQRTLPHEVGWIGGAVKLDKGCYRGQETVAKVANVGRPPRRLLLLHLDGSAAGLPETGDDVRLDGQTVGRVGTVVQHHELGPVALALVKRSVPVEAELAAGNDDRLAAAAVDPDSVPPDTGEPPGRAAIRRLRGH